MSSRPREDALSSEETARADVVRALVAVAKNHASASRYMGFGSYDPLPQHSPQRDFRDLVLPYDSAAGPGWNSALPYAQTTVDAIAVRAIEYLRQAFNLVNDPEADPAEPPASVELYAFFNDALPHLKTLFALTSFGTDQAGADLNAAVEALQAESLRMFASCVFDQTRLSTLMELSATIYLRYETAERPVATAASDNPGEGPSAHAAAHVAAETETARVVTQDSLLQFCTVLYNSAFVETLLLARKELCNEFRVAERVADSECIPAALRLAILRDFVTAEELCDAAAFDAVAARILPAHGAPSTHFAELRAQFDVEMFAGDFQSLVAHRASDAEGLELSATQPASTAWRNLVACANARETMTPAQAGNVADWLNDAELLQNEGDSLTFTHYVDPNTSGDANTPGKQHILIHAGDAHSEDLVAHLVCYGDYVAAADGVDFQPTLLVMSLDKNNLNLPEGMQAPNTLSVTFRHEGTDGVCRQLNAKVSSLREELEAAARSKTGSKSITKNFVSAVGAVEHWPAVAGAPGNDVSDQLRAQGQYYHADVFNLFANLRQSDSARNGIVDSTDFNHQLALMGTLLHRYYVDLFSWAGKADKTYTVLGGSVFKAVHNSGLSEQLYGYLNRWNDEVWQAIKLELKKRLICDDVDPVSSDPRSARLNKMLETCNSTDLKASKKVARLNALVEHIVMLFDEPQDILDVLAHSDFYDIYQELCPNGEDAAYSNLQACARLFEAGSSAKPTPWLKLAVELGVFDAAGRTNGLRQTLSNLEYRAEPNDDRVPLTLEERYRALSQGRFDDANSPFNRTVMLNACNTFQQLHGLVAYWLELLGGNAQWVVDVLAADSTFVDRYTDIEDEFNEDLTLAGCLAEDQLGFPELANIRPRHDWIVHHDVREHNGNELPQKCAALTPDFFGELRALAREPSAGVASDELKAVLRAALLAQANEDGYKWNSVTMFYTQNGVRVVTADAIDPDLPHYGFELSLGGSGDDVRVHWEPIVCRHPHVKYNDQFPHCLITRNGGGIQITPQGADVSAEDALAHFEVAVPFSRRELPRIFRASDLERMVAAMEINFASDRLLVQRFKGRTVFFKESDVASASRSGSAGGSTADAEPTDTFRGYVFERGEVRFIEGFKVEDIKRAYVLSRDSDADPWHVVKYNEVESTTPAYSDVSGASGAAHHADSFRAGGSFAGSATPADAVVETPVMTPVVFDGLMDIARVDRTHPNIGGVGVSDSSSEYLYSLVTPQTKHLYLATSADDDGEGLLDIYFMADPDLEEFVHYQFWVDDHNQDRVISQQQDANRLTRANFEGDDADIPAIKAKLDSLGSGVKLSIPHRLTASGAAMVREEDLAASSIARVPAAAMNVTTAGGGSSDADDDDTAAENTLEARVRDNLPSVYVLGEWVEYWNVAADDRPELSDDARDAFAAIFPVADNAISVGASSRGAFYIQHAGRVLKLRVKSLAVICEVPRAGVPVSVKNMPPLTDDVYNVVMDVVADDEEVGPSDPVDVPAGLEDGPSDEDAPAGLPPAARGVGDLAAAASEAGLFAITTAQPQPASLQERIAATFGVGADPVLLTPEVLAEVLKYLRAQEAHANDTINPEPAPLTAYANAWLEAILPGGGVRVAMSANRTLSIIYLHEDREGAADCVRIQHPDNNPIKVDAKQRKEMPGFLITAFTKNDDGIEIEPPVVVGAVAAATS